MKLLTSAGGLLAVLALWPVLAGAAEHRGRIVGVALEGDTGKPIAGAYAGIGDFGDAGGSNLGRFQKQGRYAHTETDEKGRFVIQGVATGEHPLVVTHPQFVRCDRTATAAVEPSQTELRIELKPAATIRVTVVDATAKPLRKPWIIRLEALDGHRFIPPGRQRHLSTFASPVWTQRRAGGDFSFTELAAGKYAVDVMEMGPTTLGYHGGADCVEVKAGAGREVQIKPADNQHQNTLTLTIPGPLDLQGADVDPSRPELQPFLLLNRNPALLLWDDGRFHHPEDHRLGRMCLSALIYGPATPGSRYRITNLPPGTYSVFAGPAVCLQGAKAEVVRGRDRQVDVGWEQPTQAAMVGTWRFNRRVSLESAEYKVQQLCRLISAKTENRPRVQADPALGNQSVKLEVGKTSIWEILEAVYLQTGWKIEEEDNETLVLRAG